MQLDELVEMLQYGEIQNTPIVDIELNAITPQQMPKLLSYINRALTALYSEFLLKEDFVTIQQVLGVGTYTINNKHAVSNTTSPDLKYILDTAEDPYLNTLIKIERVSNSSGDDIPLNNLDIAESWFTPEYDKVALNSINPDDTFSVVYRAKHAKIPLDTSDLSSVEVRIPASFVEALIQYVTSKAYGSINSEDARQASGTHFTYYLKAVQDIHKNALGINGYNVTNNKAGINGWV